eukprot:GHVS01002136.1.p1 GENE.GHVS01002136.1~~GHVS01002136.1.p1  ORF type:complete len:940 (+),score=147.48 GHVS01002136.1:101-2920(+)
MDEWVAGEEDSSLDRVNADTFGDDAAAVGDDWTPHEASHEHLERERTRLLPTATGDSYNFSAVPLISQISPQPLHPVPPSFPSHPGPSVAPPRLPSPLAESPTVSPAASLNGGRPLESSSPWWDSAVRGSSLFFTNLSSLPSPPPRSPDSSGPPTSPPAVVPGLVAVLSSNPPSPPPDPSPLPSCSRLHPSAETSSAAGANSERPLESEGGAIRVELSRQFADKLVLSLEELEQNLAKRAVASAERVQAIQQNAHQGVCQQMQQQAPTVPPEHFLSQQLQRDFNHQKPQLLPQQLPSQYQKHSGIDAPSHGHLPPFQQQPPPHHYIPPPAGFSSLPVSPPLPPTASIPCVPTNRHASSIHPSLEQSIQSCPPRASNERLLDRRLPVSPFGSPSVPHHSQPPPPPPPGRMVPPRLVCLDCLGRKLYLPFNLRLFPFTPAHRRMILSQPNQTPLPWQPPVAALAHRGLLRSHELDLILRIQLTQCAVKPQLQSVAGKWNYRLLNKHRRRESRDEDNREQQHEWSRSEDPTTDSGLFPSGHHLEVVNILSSPPSAVAGSFSPAEEGVRSERRAKFGRMSYASVRCPRSLINVERPGAACKDGGRALEQIVELSGACERHLTLRVVEEAYDALLALIEANTEIDSCPSGHVESLNRLKETRFALLDHLYELFSLRSLPSENGQLPLLSQVALSSVSTAVFPEILSPDHPLAALVSGSFCVFRQIASLPKGRRLLARTLPLMPLPGAAMLCQLALGSPSVLLAASDEAAVVLERGGGKGADRLLLVRLMEVIMRLSLRAVEEEVQPLQCLVLAGRHLVGWPDEGKQLKQLLSSQSGLKLGLFVLQKLFEVIPPKDITPWKTDSLCVIVEELLKAVVEVIESLPLLRLVSTRLNDDVVLRDYLKDVIRDVMSGDAECSELYGRVGHEMNVLALFVQKKSAQTSTS